MAGRTNYTYTAIYNRSFAKPGKFSAAGTAARSFTLEQLDRDEENTGRGDTPVLALLFFVLPVLGLFAILIQPMRWIFAAAVMLSMLTMWGLRCFMPRARLITSVVLIALTGLAVYGALAAPVMPFVNNGSLGNTAANATAPPDALTAALTEGLGSDPTTAANTGDTDSAAQGGVSQTTPMTPAETVLAAYLELWKAGNDADAMLKYTWPEWRRTLENPKMTLFSTYMSKKLVDWEYTMPAVSDMDAVVSVPVLAQVLTSNGTTARMRYGAMLYRVDDQWYIDPSSFKNGVQEVEATPSPDPNATPKPTATPTISGTLKLWYNSDGGTFYHSKKDCQTVAARYVSKMSSFTYSQIKDSKYSKLKQCTVCGAPARP